MKRCYFLGLFFLLQGYIAFSQKPVARIDFEIRGMANSYLLLGLENLDRQIILDTIRLNAQGEGFYESKVRLQAGIYVVTFPNQKYFELLIDNEQFFTIYTDTIDIFENLVITGAEQPALFLKFQKLRRSLEKYRTAKDSTGVFQTQEKLKAFKDSVASHLSSSLLAAYLRLYDLTRQLSTRPQELTLESFVRQQQERERNFIRNFPFDDNRLLHSRLLYEQLSYFFNVFISQHPDTLISRMDMFLAQAARNEAMYKYLLAFFNQNFRHCRTPAYEKVYVYLAENYYLNGKAPWADPRFLNLLLKKVDELKPSVMGVKVANLPLVLSDDKPAMLYDYNAENIILFFWDPDCETCRNNYLQLVEKARPFKRKDLLIIAVYMHSNKQPWLEFLKKYNNTFINVYDPLKKNDFAKLFRIDRVPFYVLLNSEKQIVAKGNMLDSVWGQLRK